MGKRILQVSPEFLVEILKAPGDLHRTFTIEKPLPDDARVVAIQTPATYAGYFSFTVGLVMESEAWPDNEVLRDLERPVVTVHYEKVEAAP